MLPLPPRSPKCPQLYAAANAELVPLCVNDCIRHVEATVEASVEAENASTTTCDDLTLFASTGAWRHFFASTLPPLLLPPRLCITEWILAALMHYDLRTWKKWRQWKHFSLVIV